MRSENFKKYIPYGILFTALIVGIMGLIMILSYKNQPSFDGNRAYQDILIQESFGPRHPGTGGHVAIIQWLVDELEKYNWDVSIQESTFAGKEIKNIVAKRSGTGNWVILGAHYDTRIYADRDPETVKRLEPVPGANDGASGVAVLLELARELPLKMENEIWLVFFDAEDNGRIGDWDWILGSQAFAQQLIDLPDSVVIVDMIGDADLDIYKEKNSDPELTDQIWGQAKMLGYENNFIDEYKHAILDDHIPFVNLGIPAVDIIDFNYLYYHTTQDTSDKVSSESLQVVGTTLLHWLLALH